MTLCIRVDDHTILQLITPMAFKMDAMIINRSVSKFEISLTNNPHVSQLEPFFQCKYASLSISQSQSINLFMNHPPSKKAPCSRISERDPPSQYSITSWSYRVKRAGRWRLKIQLRLAAGHHRSLQEPMSNLRCKTTL